MIQKAFPVFAFAPLTRRLNRKYSQIVDKQHFTGRWIVTMFNSSLGVLFGDMFVYRCIDVIVRAFFFCFPQDFSF